MNDELTTNETPQLQIPLDVRNRGRILSLARWSNVLGILTIIWGIINLISLFTYKGNILLLLPVLGITIFFIYLGSRLTASSAHLRQSVDLSNGDDLLTGLDQLRTYFTICVGFFILLFFFIITMLILYAAFGTAMEKFTV